MKITIPSKIYDQIQFFVDRSTIECSGLGKVVVTPEGYAVTEITLLEQENTATHTEIDASAVCKAMFQLRESQGGVYFWWHSHVNMDVFWSGTDKATIEEIGRNGLCVAVVFNKKRERKGAVWLKGSELSPDLYFSDIPVSIDYGSIPKETQEAWAKEFDEKCKAKQYKATTNSAFSAWEGYQSPWDKTYPLKGLGDNFDLLAFEATLYDVDKKDLTLECHSLMEAQTLKQVDDHLAQITAIVKRSKASKHDKRKAIKEYKEMANDQKNWLIDKFADATQGTETLYNS